MAASRPRTVQDTDKPWPARDLAEVRRPRSGQRRRGHRARAQAEPPRAGTADAVAGGGITRAEMVDARRRRSPRRHPVNGPIVVVARADARARWQGRSRWPLVAARDHPGVGSRAARIGASGSIRAKLSQVMSRKAFWFTPVHAPLMTPPAWQRRCWRGRRRRPGGRYRTRASGGRCGWRRPRWSRTR